MVGRVAKRSAEDCDRTVVMVELLVDGTEVEAQAAFWSTRFGIGPCEGTPSG